MTTRCEEALALVWAAEIEDAPETPELAEARRHLAACGGCRAYLRRDSVLAARIRDLRLCGATPCPDAVRRLVAERLGAESVASGDESMPEVARSLADQLKVNRRHWPPWVEGAIAAGVAAILIAGGLMLSDRLEAGLPDDVFVDDFHRTSLPEIVRTHVAPAEVEEFYRVQFAGDGPTIMIDAPVTKVAVCKLDGRMGAMVEYDYAGKRLVYYQVPREDSDRPGPAMRTGVEGELSVTRWGDSKYDYALVSAMPEEDLETLAVRART